MVTVEDIARPKFLKRSDSAAVPSAPQPPIGVSAESVSPLLASFLRWIEPYLPEEMPDADSDAMNDLVSGLFDEHADAMDLSDITPAAAYIALKAVETASACHALDPVSQAMVGSGAASNKLASLIARSTGVRRKADMLARVDWLISDIEEYASDYLTSDAGNVLDQIRRDVLALVPDGVLVDNRPVARESGPTVGDIRAVEKAFTKVGMTIAQAHEAVGFANSTGEPF